MMMCEPIKLPEMTLDDALERAIDSLESRADQYESQVLPKTKREHVRDLIKRSIARDREAVQILRKYKPEEQTP